jgi:hypothetical protein
MAEIDDDIVPVAAPCKVSDHKCGSKMSSAKQEKDQSSDLSANFQECLHLEEAILKQLEAERHTLECQCNDEIRQVHEKYSRKLKENAQRYKATLVIIREFKTKLQRVASLSGVSTSESLREIKDFDKEPSCTPTSKVAEPKLRSIRVATPPTKEMKASVKSFSNQKKNPSGRKKEGAISKVPAKVAVRTAPLRKADESKIKKPSEAKKTSETKQISRKRSMTKEDNSKVFKRTKELVMFAELQRDWRELRPQRLSEMKLPKSNLLAKSKYGSYRKPGHNWSPALRLLTLPDESGTLLLTANVEDDPDSTSEDFLGNSEYLYMFPPRFETCVDCGIFEASEEPGAYCDGCNVFVHHACMGSTAPKGQTDPYFCHVCLDEQNR